MPDSQITTRAFRWEDVPAFAAVQNSNPRDAERWLRQSNLQPERDCVIAFSDDTPVGYAYVISEPAVSRAVLIAGAIATADSTINETLLDQALQVADAQGLAVLQIDVAESDSASRELCERNGMRHIRTHLHLRRPDSNKAPLTLPKDATIRIADRNDVPAITALQNAAFTGSWGYAPNTEEEIGYRIFDLPALHPDPVMLLEVGGELVGYCWTHRESTDSPGIVGMVGVQPGVQGKGYGKLITAAGINHLLEIGALPIDITVDSENAPAIRVYESLGFALDWRSFWYERTLP